MREALGQFLFCGAVSLALALAAASADALGTGAHASPSPGAGTRVSFVITGNRLAGLPIA